MPSHQASVHEFAGRAMQGLIENQAAYRSIEKSAFNEGSDLKTVLARISYEIAEVMMIEAALH